MSNLGADLLNAMLAVSLNAWLKHDAAVSDDRNVCLLLLLVLILGRSASFG